MAVFVVLGVVLLVWGLISQRLAHYSITAPIAMMVAGALFGGGSDPVIAIELSTEAMRELLEVTLAVLLFVDATEVTSGWLRRSGAVPARLLGLGFPLTVLAGFVAALLVFSEHGVWVAALLAATVAATDAALASAVIGDSRIPRRLRRIINVESGLNDGLATPLVLLFVSLAVSTEDGGGVGNPLAHAAIELALGVAAGVAVGAASAWMLVAARRAGWSAPIGERIGLLAVAVVAWAGTVMIGGNGFVAAFVAGIAFGAVGRDRLPDSSRQLAGDLAALLCWVVWFIFGALAYDTLAAGIGAGVVLFAVLALTVVRMVPVALALVGTGLSAREVLLLGWIGPRGLATIVFGLIAIEELGDPPVADLVAQVVVVTVLISVVVHGLSAGVIAARWPSTVAERA